MRNMQVNKRDDGRADALKDPRDLVLTASAGTGKTTMLVKKFTRVLIDKIHEQRSAESIRSLVGITFTELAAMELKDRIRIELHKAAEKKEAENQNEIAQVLRDAVRDLDTAYVGTIHSFCRRVLQENFVAAGISPGFRVLDERDAVELKNRAVFEVFRTTLSPQSLEKDRDPLVLVQSLGLGNVREHIQKMLDTFRAFGDEEINVDDYIARVEEIGKTAEDVMAEAQTLLEKMEADVASFNASGGNKTSQKIGAALLEARVALEPYFGQPSRLLRNCLPELLNKKSCLPGKGNTKGLDEYTAFRQRFLQLLNLDKGGGTSLRDLEMLDLQIVMLRTLLTLVNRYAKRYSSLKESSESLDFDDLQLRALRLLESDERVITHYRTIISHIFVDEFQDVNAVQRRLVQLLRGFDMPDAERRRLFLVGDSKQSIYRFRAADVRAYSEFADTIAKHGNSSELRLNFRSHENLIESFNKLFGPLFAAEEESAAFQAAYQPIEPGKDEYKPAAMPLVRILELNKSIKRYEAKIVAGRIRNLVENGMSDYEGKFGYGDIAILFRSTSKLPEYEIELRRAGIPHAVIGGKGFYLQREIQDISCYLNAVWFPEDEYALAAALRSPLCLVSDESLYELNKTGYFRDELPAHAPLTPAMEKSEYERFKRFNAMLSKHRSLRDLVSTADMIDTLLETTGYDAVLLAQNAGDQGAANVRKLIEMAREFEAHGVGTGLEFALDLSSRLFTDKEESQASLVGSENAVKLLTVHKSKGLEFPVVILADLAYGGKPLNDPVVYDHEVGIATSISNPDTGRMIKSGLFNRINSRINEEDDAEHLRLFYVAATRAQELLILPIARDRIRKSQVKSWLKRLDEINALDPDKADEFGLGFEDDEPYARPHKQRLPLIQRFSDTELAVDDQESKEALERFERMLKRPKTRKSSRFQLSVSSLIALMSNEIDKDYRTEMQQLQNELEGENVIDTAPRATGTAIHNYLESLDYSARPDPASIRDSLLRLGIQPPVDDGIVAVNRWFDSPVATEFLSDADCRIRTEVPFVLPLQLEEETIDIIGVIDLLAEFGEGRRWLIDFKYAHQKVNQAYRIQMQLYALAVRLSLGKAPEQTILYWLRDGVTENIETHSSILDHLKLEIADALQRKRESLYL